MEQHIIYQEEKAEGSFKLALKRGGDNSNVLRLLPISQSGIKNDYPLHTWFLRFPIEFSLRNFLELELLLFLLSYLPNP